MENISFNELTSLANNAEVIALWVYGSHAKGNANDNSDIDIAVIFRESLSDVLQRRTRPEILAIEWCQLLGLQDGGLSILDLEIAPIPLAMSVLTTGKQLISLGDSKEFFITQKIMSKWEIDYQYHYKHYG